METLILEILKNLGISIFSAFVILAVMFLSKEAILARLTKSIEHEYALKIENFKFQIETKKKAELVAKLLAHWITYPEEQEELNRMTFECFLWLPDDIANDLSDLLSHKREHEVTIRSVIISIRKHLNNGNENYSRLNDNQVIIFTKQSKKKQLENLLKSL